MLFDAWLSAIGTLLSALNPVLISREQGKSDCDDVDAAMHGQEDRSTLKEQVFARTLLLEEAYPWRVDHRKQAHSFVQ